MTPPMDMNSPAWPAAGWTMVHLGWVVAAIGLVLVVLRRLLGTASPEVRQAPAVAGRVLWVISPLAVFGWLYRPAPDMTATSTVVTARVGTASAMMDVHRG